VTNVQVNVLLETPVIPIQKTVGELGVLVYFFLLKNQTFSSLTKHSFCKNEGETDAQMLLASKINYAILLLLDSM